SPYASLNLFNVFIHATRLLFPVVTCRDGLDTSITVSNITSSPFGTPPQTGSAWLYFYGSNGPEPFTTGAIGAGNTYSFLVSSIAPGFHGYVVALCYFYPARGYAMINAVGSGGVGTGYLAEILEPAVNEVT